MADENIIANDLERFRTDINRFGEAADKMENCRVRMFNELAALNGMWEGEAHDVLISRFESDNAFTEDYIAFLRQLVNNCNDAHAAYTRCEADVADVIAAMNLGEA